MPTDAYIDPVERRIREAIERGEFEDLPGAGKPIPDLDRQYEAGWWAKRYLERMRLEDAADELRRTIAREQPILKTMSDRARAESRAAELNSAVEEINERLSEGDRLPQVSPG